MRYAHCTILTTFIPITFAAVDNISVVPIILDITHHLSLALWVFWPWILTWRVHCIVVLLPVVLRASLVALKLAWYSHFTAHLMWQPSQPPGTSGLPGGSVGSSGWCLLSPVVSAGSSDSRAGSIVVSISAGWLCAHAGHSCHQEGKGPLLSGRGSGQELASSLSRGRVRGPGHTVIRKRVSVRVMARACHPCH